jgi:competence protein ComFC
MLSKVSDLIFPPVCALCRKRVDKEKLFCPGCFTLFEIADKMPCRKCGIQILNNSNSEMLCASCQNQGFVFERTISVLSYEGAAREAIHLFKYKKNLRVGSWLSSLMSSIFESLDDKPKIDYVVSVPMYWWKNWFKGFNHADILAKSVSRQLNMPYSSKLIVRRKPGLSQTNLDRKMRFKNVERAFLVKKEVPSKNILLVDDVITSGATANACALALKKAGAKSVFILTAAATRLQ